MNLIKLHWGLIKYIKSELTKKRKLVEWVRFFQKLSILYFKNLLNIYRYYLNFLDKDFREQRKKYYQLQRVKKELTGMVKLLRYSKEKLRKAGVSRKRIRKFFRDLGNDEETLNALCDELLREIGG